MQVSATTTQGAIASIWRRRHGRQEGIMSNRVHQFFLSLAATAALLAGIASPAGAAQITLYGSTGMLPLTTELVQAFKSKQSATPIEVGNGNSNASPMHGVADGRLSLGLSSEPPGEAERAAGLRAIEIARVAVVFAVHTSVTVPGLTTQQLCDIYARKIKNWKWVGGADLLIVPFTRPADEFEPTIIKKQYSCFKEAEWVLILPKVGDMARVLATKTGAIGMINSTYIESSHGAIRALHLNGVAPTAENVLGGVYPLVHRFFFITKGVPAGPVAQFVAFVKSADGERVIRSTHAVPVKN